MAKRQRKIRVTFAEHTQEEYAQAFRDHIGERGVLWDYFSSIIASRVWERGRSDAEVYVAEGMRALADDVLAMAMSKPEIKVQTNQEE